MSTPASNRSNSKSDTTTAAASAASPSRPSAVASPERSDAVSPNPLSGATEPQQALADALNRLAAAQRSAGHKLHDHGRDAALAPGEGAHVPHGGGAVSASTLSEKNASAKTAGTPDAGANEVRGNLGRVRADNLGRVLSTNQGVAIADNQNSLKAGLRGPALLEDFILREKITHFDHERIPERIVHARGSGAHGYFECTQAVPELTCASPLQEAGKRTPVFVRFSTVAGERGSIDTARDVRGFAVKFYTDEGNWDLVGNNMPVFFIQDAMKFPDLIHAAKPEPHHGMPQAATAHDTFWDFVSLSPESTHMMMWAMSDRAIPRSYRMMEGFGVHTFRLVDAQGGSRFVKFHWKPREGAYSLVWDEAVKIAGADADFHRRDLWEAIEAGACPEWDLGLQVFSEAQAEGFSFDVLDPTKIVPEELVPVRIVGRMVLDRNPDNFFAETEQVAFCAAHVIPGIDFSNDPLLAGRIHSYVDTQISRLGGANFHEIPINAPLASVHNNQRDGMHRQTLHRGRVAYEPNSLGAGCPHQAGARGFISFPQPLEGEKLRGKPEKFADHYTQAALFYDSQTDWEREHIAAAFRFELSKVTVPAVRERMVASLRNASEALAAQVARGLGMDQLPEALPRVLASPPKPEVERSPALSLTAHPGQFGVRSRQVAFLVAEGTDVESLNAVVLSLLGEGAVPHLVAPRVGTLIAADGSALSADRSLENAPGVLFDAVVIPCGDAAAKALSAEPLALDFVRQQWRHGKPIMAIGSGRALLGALGLPADAAGVVACAQPDAGASAPQFVQALAQHRFQGRVPVA